MDFRALANRLDDAAEQAGAAQELVATDRAAIAELVSALHRPGSATERAAIAEALRRIGPSAYRALIEELATAENAEAVESWCSALGIASDDDVARYAREICGDDPDDRATVAHCIGYLCKTEQAQLLVPLLADPVSEVRRKAIEAFGRLGRETIPLLRRVRRSSLPERRGALAALAQLGWDTPEPRDLAILARFMRRKIAADAPTPFIPYGEWYAVETTDHASVLEVLGLSDAVPVPWSMGTSISQPPSGLLQHAAYPDHWYCAQVYVSPALDGWIFVFGEPVTDPELSHHDRAGTFDGDDDLDNDQNDSDEDDEVHRQRQSRCAALSERFGSARWFGQDFESGCGDWWGWCIAEHAEIVRYYATSGGDGAVTVGPSHPAETGLRFANVGNWLRDNGFSELEWDWTMMTDPILAQHPHPALTEEDEEARAARGPELWREFQLRTGIPDAAVPMHMAARTSPDLRALGPETQVVGHGVLALTACGRRLGHRGALIW